MENKSKIGLHQGEALLRIANTYMTLEQVVYEVVQNAIDARANEINIVINNKARTITITDNGDGVTKSKFEQALTSICSSIKDQSSLGQFGMGLISPLGKCKRFTFTSTHKDNGYQYLEWTFDTDGIRKQHDVDGIPMVVLPNLKFGRVQKQGITTWKTKVKLENFTKDRTISKLLVNDLKEGILDRFSKAMCRNKTTMYIRIINDNGHSIEEHFKASKYEGRPLKKFKVNNNDEDVTFDLYIAPQTTKGFKGNVYVGEMYNDFRLSFRQFAKNELMDGRIVAALQSGVFSGEILSNRAKLHPDRKKFIMNDDLVSMCMAIEKWYYEIGKEYLDKVNEQLEDTRLQVLGVKAMAVVEEMLKNPTFSDLNKLLKEKPKYGTVGQQHTEVDAETEYQEIPSISTRGRSKGEKVETGTGNPRKRSKSNKEKTGLPRGEYENHIPWSAFGGKGKLRKNTKFNSTGLQIMHISVPGSSKLWEFDIDHGLLCINIDHPIWIDCDAAGDKILLTLQEWIIIRVLIMYSSGSDEWIVHNILMMEQQAPLISYWFINRDKISGRNLKKSKGE